MNRLLLLVVALFVFAQPVQAAEKNAFLACDIPGFDPVCNSGGITVTLPPPLSVGGVTITGSGTLFFRQLNGMGIVDGGGLTDEYINNGETATFTFENGPVTGVQIHAGGCGPMQVTTAEVFGVGGASLGTFVFNPCDGNISTLVGHAKITSFRVSETGHLYRPGRIRYLPSPADQLAELAGLIVTMNLQAGISNALDAKLDHALNALDDTNVNNDAGALNAMQSFCQSVEVQRGKKLTIGQANQLLADANAVIEAIDPLAPRCEIPD